MRVKTCTRALALLLVLGFGAAPLCARTATDEATSDILEDGFEDVAQESVQTDTPAETNQETTTRSQDDSTSTNTNPPAGERGDTGPATGPSAPPRRGDRGETGGDRSSSRGRRLSDAALRSRRRMANAVGGALGNFVTGLIDDRRREARRTPLSNMSQVNPDGGGRPNLRRFRRIDREAGSSDVARVQETYDPFTVARFVREANESYSAVRQLARETRANAQAIEKDLEADRRARQQMEGLIGRLLPGGNITGMMRGAINNGVNAIFNGVFGGGGGKEEGAGDPEEGSGPTTGDKGQDSQTDPIDGATDEGSGDTNPDADAADTQEDVQAGAEGLTGGSPADTREGDTAGGGDGGNDS